MAAHAVGTSCLALLLAYCPLKAQLAEYSRFGRIFPGGRSACGVHCLYIASRLMDMHPDLNEIGTTARLRANGVSLLDLKRAAESIGLGAKGYRYDVGHWSQVKPLTIVHLKDNHFVLVLSTDDRGVNVVDAQKGRLFWTGEKFKAMWSGHALELARASPPKQSARHNAADGPSVRELRIAVSPTGPLTVLAELVFGDILAERHYPFEIHVRNELNKSLQFERSLDGCGCARVVPDVKTIRPSAEATLRGRFVTVGMTGEVERMSLVVFIAGKKRYSLRVTLKANILTEGRMRAFPQRVNFHTSAGAPAQVQQLTIRRESHEPVKLISVEAADLWLRCDLKATSPRGGDRAVVVDVSYDSSLPVGKHETRIKILADHPRFPSLEVRVVVRVDDDLEATPTAIVREFSRRDSVQDVGVRLRSISGIAFEVTSVKVNPPWMGDAKIAVDESDRSVSLQVRLKPFVSNKRRLVRGNVVATFDHPLCSKLVIPIFAHLDVNGSEP